MIIKKFTIQHETAIGIKTMGVRNARGFLTFRFVEDYVAYYAQYPRWSKQFSVRRRGCMYACATLPFDSVLSSVRVVFNTFGEACPPHAVKEFFAFN